MVPIRSRIPVSRQEQARGRCHRIVEGLRRPEKPGYPEAKVAYLAVFRRTSLIVGFTISALYFGERNVIWKCVMVLGLVCGISIVIVG